MEVAALAKKLIQFETTHEKPDQIQECLNFCKSYLDGFPVIIKEFVSEGIPSIVIQTKDTTDVDVLLLGHIDTIPGPDELFEGKEKDGKLYGRGSLDMKAFVATSLQVLRELLEEGYLGNIALAIVSDEELGGKNGANYLVNTIGYNAKVVLVPDDGERIENIVTETKHILHLEFFAKGKEAHGCQPWFGKNAILDLIKTYKNLETHFEECLSAKDEQWVNTINLGMIEGGVATNEVPSSAKMSVDIRFTKNTSKEQMIHFIEQSCEKDVHYKIRMEGFPTILEEEDPFLKSYAQLVIEEIGRPVTFLKSGGGTDGRYFAEKGMKVLVHQSNGGNCQAEDEYVEVDGLSRLVNIQKKFIVKNF
ncbi:MAG: hypothetical protein COV59_05005 [Candidatus Magasanikbacteria bacterium CG11_big_fil_rev_8_21_14_0_20_39_34]|uniref:Peptidase M20 dimerisation domain-containing protein n=1 Tax=Candidatus Magasanikbacteria bacterium CG11_big_fil_rev_8_21_14_0_20_39_34 TaxID=1974653 RepID=A0A2H0N3P7_9BACT|nr:MAG: hypothetical protein COV59_05005 [Candidatus Magasanikbacteria bacterium CG11_big_fil_rev_8_21_14_0_20_39_34]